jgi:prevent-host-death family protein
VNTLINAKELRASLPSVIEQVRRGTRFTVVYRSRPAFHLIPVEDTTAGTGDLKSDSLYRAKSLGRSRDGRKADDHDAILYSK